MFSEDQSMMPEEEEDLLDSPNLEEITEQGEQKEQVPLNNAEEEQSPTKDKTAKEETDVTSTESIICYNNYYPLLCRC